MQFPESSSYVSYFSGIAHSISPIFPQHQQTSRCGRRTNIRPSLSILSVKFLKEVTVFLYETYILVYNNNTRSHKVHPLRRKVDFLVCDVKNFSFLLLFSSDSESSNLDFSFSLMRKEFGSSQFETPTTKKGYKFKGLIAVEAKEGKIFTITMGNIIEIWHFDNQLEIFLKQSFPIDIPKTYQLISLHVYAYDNMFYLELNNEEQLEKEIICFGESPLEKKRVLNINGIDLNNPISGIFNKAEEILVLTQNGNIYSSSDPINPQKISEMLPNSLFYMNSSSQIVAYSENKLRLFKYVPEKTENNECVILLDCFKFKASPFCSYFFSVHNDSILMLESATNLKKHPNLIDFELISLEKDIGLNVLLKAYQSNLTDRIQCLEKTLVYSPQELLRIRWQACEKQQTDILEILMRIEDLEYFEQECFSLKNSSLQFDVIEKLLVREWDLLMVSFRESVGKNFKGLSNQAKKSAVETYWKLLENKQRMNSLKSFLALKGLSNEEVSLFHMEEVLNFFSKDKMSLFLSLVSGNKPRTAKVVLENHNDLIFSNFWRLFMLEGTFIRTPEKLLALLPMKNPSKSCESYGFIWEIFSKTNKKSMFDSFFWENFPEMGTDLLDSLRNYAEMEFLDDERSIYLKNDCSFDLNSMETYLQLEKLSYLLSGDPEKSLILLDHGYKHGFDGLKSRVLLYRLLSLAIHSMGNEALSIEDFEALADFERLGVIIEGCTKENRFVGLLTGPIRDIFQEFGEEGELKRLLKMFSLTKKCSVKVFIEVFRFLLSSSENSREIIGFLESFKEKRLLCEHHKELSAIIELLKRKFPLESEEYVQECLNTSEIAQILYAFSLNPSISELKALDFLTTLEELLQNLFLNRLKETKLYLSTEMLSLEPITSQIIQMLSFRLRDLLLPKANNSSVLQIIIRKLLENSKFSMLQEMLDREKLLKKIDVLVFEALVQENISKTYETANSLERLEYPLRKSLTLLGTESQVRLKEKALFEALKRIESIQIKKLSLGALRRNSKERSLLLSSLVSSLRDKEELKNILEIKSLFAEFDDSFLCNNPEDEGFFKFVAEKAIEIGDFDGLKQIIELLETKNTDCLNSIIEKTMESSNLPTNLKNYLHRLVILGCSNPKLLLKVLENKPSVVQHKTNIDLLIVDTLMLDKNTKNKPNIDSLLLDLYKSQNSMQNPVLRAFLEDLTINPGRAFFQLSLSDFDNIELLEKIAFSLLKSELFDLERLCLGLLTAINIRIGSVEPLGIGNIQAILTNKSDKTSKKIKIEGVEKKTAGFIEKMENLLEITRKMQKIGKFLRNTSEEKRFLFDTAFRNEKLVSILFETQDLDLFDEFNGLLPASSFNLRDLYISKLVKDFSECDRKSTFGDFHRFMDFLKKDKTQNEPLLSMQRVYEKIRFKKPESLVLFLEVLSEVVTLNEKKALCMLLLNEIIGGANELRSLIPEIVELVDGGKLPLSRDLKPIIQLLDESNVILIAKSIEVITESREIAEKVYSKFLKKELKSIEGGRSYECLMQEMQKIVAIAEKFTGFTIMEKTLRWIARRQSIRQVEVFEIYSNVYSFLEERMKNKYPGKDISEFLKNAGSLIDCKMRSLRHYKGVNELKDRELAEKLGVLREESLYEEETIFELIDLMLRKLEVEYEGFAFSLNLLVFERFLVMKVEEIVVDLCDQPELESQIKEMVLKGKSIEMNEKTIRFFTRMKRFLNGMGKRMDDEKLWGAVERFLSGDFILQEDLSDGKKLLVIEVMMKEWKLNGEGIKNTWNRLRFEMFLNSQTNLKMEWGSVKDVTEMFELPIFVLVNMLQTAEKKEDLLIQIYQNPIKTKTLLALANIGMTPASPEIMFVKEIKEFLYNPPKEAEKILQFINKFSVGTMISPEVYKLMISAGVLADLLSTDHYSQVLDYFLHSCQQSCELNQSEKQLITSGMLFEDEISLYLFQEACWYGKSKSEVLLNNVVRLIERNEYYDAAKLNYLVGYKGGTLAAIGTMMYQLRKGLEEAGEKLGQHGEDKEMVKRVRSCIEVLKKLNK